MNAALFLNQPIYFQRDIYVYPPLVKDMVGRDYGKYVGILTQSQEDIWDMMAEKEGEIPKEALTPFEILLINCHHSPKIKMLAEDALRFFIHEDVSILTDSKIIIIMSGLEKVEKVEDLRYIDEENYFEFQNLLREVCGKKQLEKPNPNENAKVAIIKAKGRKRDRIIEKKGSTSSISFPTMLVAICCMGIGITPLNIGEISYIAISELFSKMQDKEKYQNDLQLIAGGAVDTKKVKVKHWIKNEK